VVIADRVFVGADAIILPGMRIGDDSVVGAGAVGSGITDAHKRAQREALAGGIAGYLAGTPERR
jgi:acetyltransferase-like isoleucine patch superfamily enzyme